MSYEVRSIIFETVPPFAGVPLWRMAMRGAPSFIADLSGEGGKGGEWVRFKVRLSRFHIYIYNFNTHRDRCTPASGAGT